MQRPITAVNRKQVLGVPVLKIRGDPTAGVDQITADPVRNFVVHYCEVSWVAPGGFAQGTDRSKCMQRGQANLGELGGCTTAKPPEQPDGLAWITTNRVVAKR